MKAILFAAGLGSRLRPITNKLPKCLVNLQGKPILQHWIEKLKRLGVKEFLVNTHYMAELVEAHLSLPIYTDLNVKIVYEPVLLGTGGTLIANRDFVNDDCFLVHVDTFVKDELHQMVAMHSKRRKNQNFTLLTFTVDSPEHYGTVILDGDRVILKFIEKDIASPSMEASGAVFLIDHRFIEEINFFDDGTRPFDLSRDALTKLSGKGSAYLTSDNVIDIGSVQSLSRCRMLLESENK